MVAHKSVTEALPPLGDFAAALVDFATPGGQGIQLAKTLREHGYSGALIALTSRVHKPSQEVLDQLAPLQCVNKPVKRRRLYSALTEQREATRHSHPGEPEAWSAAVRGVRVLVAEDNAVNQKVVLKMLERIGCTVDAVANGQEALRAALEQQYDLVLMDCQMPEMDGFEATRRIRRTPDGSGPPIVALTANAMQGDRERCLEAGMDDYLTKPVDFQALAGAVEKWSARTRAREAV